MDLTHIMGVLGHELRTPLAAILGYYELLADGIYGEVDERQREAVHRIGQSAHQLLALIDGIQELATGSTAAEDESEPFDAAATLRAVSDRLESYAASRNVRVELEIPDAFVVHGVQARIARTFDMLLAAAIKTSTGSTLRARLETASPVARFTIDGTGLDLRRDNPANVRKLRNRGSTLTGAALRLAIAEHATRLAGGELQLARANGHVRVTVEFPIRAAVMSRD